MEQEKTHQKNASEKPRLNKFNWKITVENEYR